MAKSNSTGMPVSGLVSADLIYSAQFNGKTVRTDANGSELDAILEIASQCPELDIEQKGDQWLLEGLAVSESVIFEYLMATIPFEEVPAEAPAMAQVFSFAEAA